MSNKTELKYIEYWKTHNPYENKEPRECKACGKLLERNHFYIELRHKDGLRSHCKLCLANKKKKFYEENRIYWSQHDPYADVAPKKCYFCKINKLRIDFAKDMSKTDGLNDTCYECCFERHKNDPRINMLYNAKKRAAEKGLSFTIVKDNITIPLMCPVLNIPLFISRGRGKTENTPTLDRIDNSKGYEPNNIRVISGRANRIKNDATLAELKLIVLDLEKLSN